MAAFCQAIDEIAAFISCVPIRRSALATSVRPGCFPVFNPLFKAGALMLMVRLIPCTPLFMWQTDLDLLCANNQL